MKKLLLAAAIIFCLGFGTVWLYAQPQQQVQVQQSALEAISQTAPRAAVSAHTIGTSTTTPSIITVNTPTLVTVTVSITDPAVIPGSVNLLRLGAPGIQPTLLGVMHDDGRNGDAIAGDGVYTQQTIMNEMNPGQVQLQVVAGFRGALRRALSGILTLQVWNKYSDTSIGISFQYPNTWTPNSSPGLLYFTSSDVEVLEVSTSSLATASSLQQYAQSDITNNNCPSVDSNDQPVDHIISSTPSTVLYVLSCSASTEDYNYVFINPAGQVVKFTYHDDFDPNALEIDKLSKLQRIISTLTTIH